MQNHESVFNPHQMSPDISTLSTLILYFRAVVKRTFIFGDKIVSSVPDLTYGFASRPVAIQKNVLLSVVEVFNF